jgi:hypothetical protein
VDLVLVDDDVDDEISISVTDIVTMTMIGIVTDDRLIISVRLIISDMLIIIDNVGDRLILHLYFREKGRGNERGS